MMTVGRRLAWRRTMVSVVLALGVVSIQPAAWAGPKGPKPPPSPGDSTPPTAPTNLRVTATTKTSISLAWNPSTDNSGTFSYVVKQDNLSWTVAQNQTSTSLTWLSPGRTYTFYVYAVDRALNVSGNSNTVVATTQPDLTPPTAPALSVPAVSPSQIWLRWTEAVDDMPYTGVGYSIYLNGSLATAVNWINHRDASLRHLSPGTTYAVQVKARDASGNTSESNVVSIITPASSDTTPPTAPTNLRIDIDQGCAEVWLAWTQSTDNVDPQSAIEYEVYINGVLSPLGVDTGVGRSFAYGTNHGLNSFVVRAVDRSGNTSGASNTITAELWPC
ncbi:MAG TPA: fibronectin type III domain-containing protein [Acidimicrobiales bacterium]|nr:fibronectin type III domain-containing protein [Acidimicrobiales bacterium]